MVFLHETKIYQNSLFYFILYYLYECAPACVCGCTYGFTSLFSIHVCSSEADIECLPQLLSNLFYLFIFFYFPTTVFLPSTPSSPSSDFSSVPQSPPPLFLLRKEQVFHGYS